MDFVREYSAAAGFPIDLLYSCFFQTGPILYGLAAQKKQLYKYHEGRIAAMDLIREYKKIVPNSAGQDFYAYMQMNPGSEINIFHLDEHFKEFDSWKLKTAERNHYLEDICFDGIQECLFLVYPGSILKYNCNGDFLGCFLGAPPETAYCSMCTFNQFIFISYRKKGGTYIAMYTNEGRYKERISLGNEYTVYGMQAIQEKHTEILRLYLSKNKAIPLFLEIMFHKPEPPCEIRCELIKSDGIGSATCHVETPFHTYQPVT